MMPPEEVSLRDALEQAYDSGSAPETGGSEKDTPEPVRDTAPAERAEPTAGEPAEGAEPDAGEPAAKRAEPKGDVEPLEAEPKVKTRDKAPESWKPAAREFWQKLPPEARAEVQRREAEMSQFMQRTSGQRKIAEQFVDAVNPYLGMIKAEGGNPIQTIQNLLSTAAFLRTGPAAQKAVMVAKLVKDFGISIQDLDAALVGENVPDDPNEKIQRLLDERLRPVNELLENVNSARSQREQQTSVEVDNAIQAFANDPKNEFFSDVQQDMADRVELAARRGRPITLKQAYDRAVAEDEEIQATLKSRIEAKKTAGSSVALRGPQSTTASGPKTLRDTLEESFNSVANR